jgi:hypothetical protein
MSQYKLITALLARSQSKVWWQAQLEWEYEFYRQIQRKQFKKLSPKRASIKIEINHKILRRIRNNKK